MREKMGERDIWTTYIVELLSEISETSILLEIDISHSHSMEVISKAVDKDALLFNNRRRELNMYHSLMRNLKNGWGGLAPCDFLIRALCSPLGVIEFCKPGMKKHG